MKRLVIAGSIGLLSSCLSFLPAVGAQEGNTPADTPAAGDGGVVPANTTPSTIEAPPIAPAVTEPVSEPATPETTVVQPAAVDPAPTTTALPPLDLSFDASQLLGEQVTSGSLSIDLEFLEGDKCKDEFNLGGTQMNSLYDKGQGVSVLYGMSSAEGKQVAALVAGLGIFPVGVAVVSAVSPNCSVDAIGLGGAAVDGRDVTINGIGVGIVGGKKDLKPDFVRSFNVTSKVGAVGGAPTLDVGKIAEFLTRQR
jgi:hypothetical protein